MAKDTNIELRNRLGSVDLPELSEELFRREKVQAYIHI